MSSQNTTKKMRLDDGQHEDNSNAHLEFWQKPEFIRKSLSNWQIWWTNCGRYRIARIISSLADGDNYFAASAGKEKLIAPQCRTLEQAIDAIVKYHEAAYGISGVTTNADEILGFAHQHNYTNVPVQSVVPRSVPAASTQSVQIKEGVTEGRRGGKRYTLYGQPITAILRWMGKHNWTTKEARIVLNELGMSDVAEPTIQAQVKGWQHRGEPASLGTNDETTLNKLREVGKK